MLSNHRISGAALISVLLVVSLLSWVISYFIGLTQQNVRLVGLQQNRVLAEIEADSMVDEIIFLHLTNRYIEEKEYVKWNYRGDWFSLREGVNLRLQDSQGKFSLSGLNKNLFSNFLQQNDFEVTEANRLIDCLDDWQDPDEFKRLNGEESTYYVLQGTRPPRNASIQSLSELTLVCGFPNDVNKQSLIMDNMLLFTSGTINPLFASNEVIKALPMSPALKKVLRSAKEGADSRQASKVIQNTNELSAISIAPSKEIEMELIIQRGDSQARRNVVFSYNLRYKPRPVLQFWHWSE